MYAPHIPPNRHNGVAMGMVAGTTMAMSAGEYRFLMSFKSGVPNTSIGIDWSVAKGVQVDCVNPSAP